MRNDDAMDTANLEAAARRYRDIEAALDAARTDLQAEAVAFLQRHDERGSQAAAARITGWSREHIRNLWKKAEEEAERARREAEVEALRRKVEELSATGKPQPAAAAPRVQVSAAVPPGPEGAEPDAEATTARPLPELPPKEFRKVVAQAMSRAKSDQRERLNRTAKVAEQMGCDKNDAVLRAAFEMELLTHDEVYGAAPERPASGEETTA